MTLTAYLEKHELNARKFAERIKVAPSTAYRWLAWEAGADGGTRPDPDQIVSIQTATGGLVTVINWTTSGREANRAAASSSSAATAASSDPVSSEPDAAA